MQVGRKFKKRIKYTLKIFPFCISFAALGYFILEAYRDPNTVPTHSSKNVLKKTYIPDTSLQLYRAPTAGDAGQYYLLSHKKNSDGYILILTSRVGRNNENTAFTKLKVDCRKKRYLILAGSVESGAKDTPTMPLSDRVKTSEWTAVILGSSKFDLIQLVCEQSVS